MIGGDPNDLRRHATTLRGWADSVDEESGRLRRSEDVEWKSTAGDSFRGLVATAATGIGTVSAQIREAATGFDHLADTLEDRQQWLEAAKQRIEDGIESVEDVVERGAQKAWHDAGSLVHGLRGLL